METPYPESGLCSDCAGEAPTSQDEIVVPSSLVEGMDAEEGSGGYVTPCQEHGFYAGFFTFILFEFNFIFNNLLMFPFFFIISEQGIAVECLGKHILSEGGQAEDSNRIGSGTGSQKKKLLSYGKGWTPYRPRIKSSSLSPQNPSSL